MTSEQVKRAALLVALGVLGVVGYRAYRGAADVGQWIGSALDEAWQGTKELAAAPLEATIWHPAVVPGGQEATRQIQAVAQSVFDLFKPAPAVPVGGTSVQRKTTTDLPEGSYQAAAMFWSLYPNAVFYD